MKKIFLFAALFISTYLQAQQKPTNDDLKELKTRLEGNFDNTDQSAGDGSYADISLHMKAIWGTKKNEKGFWLYAEQSPNVKSAKPTRQQVYHLYLQDKKYLVCKVYEVNNPEKVAGAWNDDKKLQKLTKESITESEGCSIYLEKDEEGNFIGGTKGKSCHNMIEDVYYNTSDWKVYPDLLVIWEKGRDENDNLISGPVKGGYKLRKFNAPKDKD